MFRSWRLGRAAGIDLYLHPTFLLLLAFAFATQGGLLAVAFTVAVFGCVLLHEFGHALTARAFGIPTQDITLYPIGGVARLERVPKAPGAELLITLAGPAVNVAIAGLIAVALPFVSHLGPDLDGLPLAGPFLGTLLMANVALAVFNLLPAFPMDGGRIFRALLSGPLGRLRATEIAVGVGRVVAIGLPVLLIALGQFNPLHLALAGFLYLAAGAELAQVRAEEAGSGRSRWRTASGGGVWFAPPGYSWVSRGPGVWQLAPIVVPGGPSQGYRAPRSPWS